MSGVAAAASTLEVRHLTGGYADIEVLRDVSMTVRPGEVTALLGANGAGKTTLLRTIAGFLTPFNGDVLLDGDVVTQLSAFRRLGKGIAYVPEGRGIFPSLSVAENIRLFAPAGEYDACREVVTERFPHLAKRYAQRAGTLSGGEQQMLAIARVFMGKPQLVLLDEVSLGLAPMLVDVIFESLERLRDDTTAVLLVEQYASRALRLADTAHILRRGEIVFSGSAAEIDGDAVAAAYFESEVHRDAAPPK